MSWYAFQLCLVLIFTCTNAEKMNKPNFYKASGLNYGPNLEDQPSLPPFPTNKPGIFFSGVFTDNVVLQRAPQSSSVFGVVVGGTPSTTVSVSGIGHKPIQAIVDLSTIDQYGYARWKAIFPPQTAGGDYNISASCNNCEGSKVAAISEVTFGDVWFCSGQSNMWLVMHFDTSRNITFDAVRRGRYKNIRLHTTPHNNRQDGDALNYDFYTAPPPPPYTNFGGFPDGGWLKASVGSYANATCREVQRTLRCMTYPNPNSTLIVGAWYGWLHCLSSTRRHLVRE